MTDYQSKFSTNSIYHIINRGIDGQNFFKQANNYKRFEKTLSFYIEKHPPQKFSLTLRGELNKILSQSPRESLVELLAFCLMPNHFHLLVKQLQENGITTYMKNIQNSYTRYYNIKNKRIGTLYQGKFKAVMIENDEQLLHVSRYIHLNPYAARLTNNPLTYKWSSLKNYLEGHRNRLCNPTLILEMIGSPFRYKNFLEDYVDYARSLAEIKKQILE
jgi:putative transposase